MGKQIKAIKCPQCGSATVEEIKPDVYLCKNCGSEFYLDNDDININHYIHTAPATPANNLNNKNVLAGIFIGVVVVVGVFLFAVLELNKKSASPLDKDSWSNANIYFMETPDSQSVYIAVGMRTRHQKANEPSPLFIGFYDAVTKKEQKLLELPIKVGRLSVRFSRLSDGEIFFSVNDKNLFQIDKQSKSASEFTFDQYKHLRGLEEGIAKIDFLPDRIYEDCFRFVNNAGQQVFYYPIIHKTYIGYDEHNAAEGDYKSVPADAPVLTRFLFKNAVSETKKYLVQYTQKLQPGYPVEDVLLEWMDRNEYNETFNGKDSAANSKLNLVISGTKPVGVARIDI